MSSIEIIFFVWKNVIQQFPLFHPFMIWTNLFKPPALRLPGCRPQLVFRSIWKGVRLEKIWIVHLTGLKCWGIDLRCDTSGHISGIDGHYWRMGIWSPEMAHLIQKSRSSPPPGRLAHWVKIVPLVNNYQIQCHLEKKHQNSYLMARCLLSKRATENIKSSANAGGKNSNK